MRLVRARSRPVSHVVCRQTAARHGRHGEGLLFAVRQAKHRRQRRLADDARVAELVRDLGRMIATSPTTSRLVSLR